MLVASKIIEIAIFIYRVFFSLFQKYIKKYRKFRGFNFCLANIFKTKPSHMEISRGRPLNTHDLEFLVCILKISLTLAFILISISNHSN